MDLTISAVTMATIAAVVVLAAAFKLIISKRPGQGVPRSMSRRAAE
jgi:hypothetical protein